MTDNYQKVCDSTLDRMNHRDHLIRKTVVSMIPTLAAFDPDTFAHEYLNRCMQHLLGLLRKDRDKRDGKYQPCMYVQMHHDTNMLYSIHCHW